MLRKVIPLTFLLLFVASYAQPKDFTPGKSEDRPSFYQSSAEQKYQEVKDALNKADKKENGPIKDKALEKIGQALSLIGDISRGDPKTDFNQSENRGHRDIQNGDPKTTFNQSENRMHSPRFTPPPPPDPDPTPDPTPVPDPTPSPDVLDLTTWTLANSYVSGTYELSVYFTPVGEGLYDVILIVYDTTTGEAIQATGIARTPFTQSLTRQP